MRIVITAEGEIWNHENPYLEQFKEAVLVICLSGQKVTDKYKCFVSPYSFSGLGGTGYGTATAKYQALESVAEELNTELGYTDQIVFLSDGSPESLYPFHVVKEKNKYNSLHLLACPPWDFTSTVQRRSHEGLLENLSSLQSFLYWDSNELLAQYKSLDALMDAATEFYGQTLLKAIHGILEMQYKQKYYFDFASEKYVLLNDGFFSIDRAEKSREPKPIDFPIMPSGELLGRPFFPKYPSVSNDIKKDVEALIPRIDGKIICNVLRKQRIALAEANNIHYETEDCPSIGPCAGTCAKCDEELEYLTNKLMEIPENRRIYPQFDLEWELFYEKEKNSSDNNQE